MQPPIPNVNAHEFEQIIRTGDIKILEQIVTIVAILSRQPAQSVRDYEQNQSSDDEQQELSDAENNTPDPLNDERLDELTDSIKIGVNNLIVKLSGDQKQVFISLKGKMRQAIPSDVEDIVELYEYLASLGG